MSNETNDLRFDLPKNQSSVIKVIGVGGGGSNAVNHMYNLGIRGVDFVVSNTDAQALEASPVPNKIQLGVSLTEGLGAGANPEIGEEAARESLDEIKDLLSTNTKMVFITAGMGGGTGTGAAPVIAEAAREMGILTVGIVTVPFQFEGKNRLQQAEKGVDSLRQNVDSLVVINNNKLREVYGNLGFKAGFAKADEVLATAARGIAEVITHHYTANIDLRDAKTVLANSGTAIMGAASASGENRAAAAINAALDSPLLNDNHIRGAKNVLLLIVSGQNEITIDEIGEINEHIQNEAGGNANIIMGIGENAELGDDIAVTIVATGFNPDQQEKTIGRMPDKVVHTLEDDQAVSSSLYEKPVKQDRSYLIDEELKRIDERDKAEVQPSLFDVDWSQAEDNPQTESHAEQEDGEEPLFEIAPEERSQAIDLPAKAEHKPGPAEKQTQPKEEPVRRFTLDDYKALEEQLNQAGPAKAQEEEEEEALQFTVRTSPQAQAKTSKIGNDINPVDSSIAESMRLKAEERRAKLKAFNYRFRNHPQAFRDADQEPAYKRQGVDLDQNAANSQQEKQSRFRLDDGEGGPDLRSNNSFLHDNVD